MRHVPLAEFTTRAGEMAAAAEAGEEIVITRDGRDVLKLAVIETVADRKVNPRAAIEAMIANREAMRADGVRISTEELIAWKNEGRR